MFVSATTVSAENSDNKKGQLVRRAIAQKGAGIDSPTTETFNSYLGLLKHGNARKLENDIVRF